NPRREIGVQRDDGGTQRRGISRRHVVVDVMGAAIAIRSDRAERAEPRPLLAQLRVAVAQLAPDDREHVRGDASMELAPSVERRHDVARDEVAHGGEQLERRRTVLHQSMSLMSSCSTSAVRRPRLASSRLATPPSRNVRAWAMQITAHFMLPKSSQKCTAAGSTAPPPACSYAAKS